MRLGGTDKTCFALYRNFRFSVHISWVSFRATAFTFSVEISLLFRMFNRPSPTGFIWVMHSSMCEWTHRESKPFTKNKRSFNAVAVIGAAQRIDGAWQICIDGVLQE